MKIYLAAIGKLKAGPEKELCDLYHKRLRFPLEILEYRDDKELLSQIPQGSYMIALDEHGSQLTSLEFAQKWQQWHIQAPAALTFVIGGADGLSPEVKAKTQFLWSLGKPTWPHLLVRTLVLEQIYRAQQIIQGHPYHRE